MAGHPAFANPGEDVAERMQPLDRRRARVDRLLVGAGRLRAGVRGRLGRRQVVRLIENDEVDAVETAAEVTRTDAAAQVRNLARPRPNDQVAATLLAARFRDDLLAQRRPVLDDGDDSVEHRVSGAAPLS